MIVTIFNAKGGVAKTTTTANLAAALRESGHSVAAINLDPQKNLARFDVALNGVKVHDASNEWPDGERFAATLRGAGGLDGRHDFTLIDCPPSPQHCNEAALRVSDLALAPLQPDVLSYDGLGELQQLIARVRRDYNPDLAWRVLIALYFTDSPDDEFYAQQIREALPKVTLPYTIKRSPLFRGALAEGRSILDYSPRSHGARAYRDLARDVIALRDAL